MAASIINLGTNAAFTIEKYDDYTEHCNMLIGMEVFELIGFVGISLSLCKLMDRFSTGTPKVSGYKLIFIEFLLATTDIAIEIVILIVQV